MQTVGPIHMVDEELKSNYKRKGYRNVSSCHSPRGTVTLMLPAHSSLWHYYNDYIITVLSFQR